jgi:hypothetical protein
MEANPNWKKGKNNILTLWKQWVDGKGFHDDSG